MTEASFIQYLDEEYQRIQEYLSSLVDTIPVINLDAIQDADSLIISLVDQNKAYGNQIISLYKTLDSVTGAKSLHETSENPGSLTNLDSVNRLQDKLKQYEDLIQELSSENEGLFSQIRELSLQVKTIQAKQEHQQNLSMISQIHHADITAVNQPPKTTVSSARTTLVHSPNELSFDLENLFILGEVRKASEVLTQMEYRKPHHVTIEKYNSWLIKSNKVKDLEIHEALTKLKSIVEAIEYEGDQVKEQKRQSYEFEDSLDHANVSPLEKVMTQLEEKLGKVLIHNEQLRLANASQLESSRYTRGGYDRFRNSEIKEAAEHLETENGMNTEILHDKVKFLRENLEDMERELREKHAEVEILKERLEKVKSGHSRPGSVTGNENLMKELENEMKARNQAEDKLQEVVSENEELRNAYDVAKKQNETCNRRIKDLYEQLNEKDQIIDKFVRDNEQIRKNKSSLHDSNMLEQLKTDLSFKNSEISQLSRDITHLKDNRKVNAEPKSTTRRAIPQTTDDAEGSTQRLRDVSALEAALHTQEDLLFHLKQASKESKEYLIEALRKSQLDLPQVSENKLRDEPSSPTTEAQRIIKENNQIIQELIKEAHFQKVGNQMLIIPSTKRQNTSRAGDFSDMLNKLHQEEDKLIEKLSRSLKVLSQLRTSVCDILVASEDPHYLNNPALVFLQDLYTNINQVLQSLQGLSSEFAVIEKKDSENDQQVSEQKRIPKSIKDQLIRDQNELKDRLQVFAQNLNTEENHDRLSQDQEINQSLYKQLLEKDVIINEIIILFTEGLERTNESISQLAKIADSEDAFVLVGDVLNEVDVMKTKLKELVAFEQGEKPQITSNTENDEIYRRSEPRVEEHVEGDDNQDEGDVNDEVEEEIQEEEENANEHILMKLQELERENWDLKEYKNSADATLKKLQDQNSKLKMMYFTEINAVKEEQKALLEERRQLRNDVEKKGQEVTKLNQILESLQTFSNKQLEVVKDKEQKLQALTGQKKDSDQWMKDLEKKIEDFVKEKKQYEEVIAKKDEEIDLLKRESIETMQRYIELQEQHKELNHKFSEVVERIKILEEERELLVGGKTEIESKVKKLNELLQVTRNELRNCRQLVEEKNYDIEQMEDEIRSLKEAIKKERSLNKESDFVMHLKSELKSQNTELEVLKKKYSEILKLNEFLQSDVHTPTGVTRRNDQFIKELDKSSTYIRETPETVDAFQKSLKRRDAASSIEKSGYLNDSRQMHRNMSVSESNWNIEGYAKDHKNSMVLNSEPRHSKVSNIAISRDGGGHSRKISMLDEKDLEIQRLTNVLRDLTKSLGISQEAKKNIINTRMQKSSVLE